MAPPQFGPKSVVAAIEAIKQGKLVVVTDDESRENEGDLIMAAECATPANVGFIVRYTSGVICCAVCCCPPNPLARLRGSRGDAASRFASQVKGDRLDELELPPMVVNNQDPKQTAFTVSVDYKVESCPQHQSLAAHAVTGTVPCRSWERAPTSRDVARRWAQPRGFRPPTAPPPSGHWQIPRALPLTSTGPGTSSRCDHARAACSSATGTRRPRSTSARWRGSPSAACSAKFATTMAACLACLRCVAPPLCAGLGRSESPRPPPRQPPSPLPVSQLRIFCEKHGLVLTSIHDMQEYLKAQK